MDKEDNRDLYLMFGCALVGTIVIILLLTAI